MSTFVLTIAPTFLITNASNNSRRIEKEKQQKRGMGEGG